ncbi:hypothetical protein QM012_006361 [Aureobasidium pullulans]|uniref:Acetyl-CoA synthetase-like protein n=1 Tax=Aureobasidium pullulans TaxID=5580 RepID=A0ABR0TPC6_AURPU
MISTNNQEGCVILTKQMDRQAKTAPETPFVYIPRHDDHLEEGYHVVTFRDLQYAVNKTARWIEDTVGVADSQLQPVIAYMEKSNDLRYIFMVLAAMKTGYRILLPSTRNSCEGHLSLIESTNCTIFFHGAESKSDVHDLVSCFGGSITSFEVPSLKELIKGDAESYADRGDGDSMDVAVIIHTSGSTGLPKPIGLRHGYIAIESSLSRLETPNGRQNVASVHGGTSSQLCTLPFFHAMGLLSICNSIMSLGPLVLPPVGRAIDADLNLAMILAGRPEIGLFSPSILEGLVDLPGGLEALGTLKFVMFAGAPLSAEIGARISKVSRLQPFIGSTECALFDSYVVEDPEDWQYYEWCPWTGAHMESIDSDGLYEMVIKRKDNDYQGSFYSFPEIEEWRTKDLYVQHPTKSFLWAYVGRRDDMIVFSNGEKFNPVALEKFMEADQNIKGALVVGQGRFQASLLIEPKLPEDPNMMLERIWPRVEQANELVPAYARVWKTKIAFAVEGKRFKRSAKGSIIRRATSDLFVDEINALLMSEQFSEELGHLDPQSNMPAIEAVVRRAVRLTMPNLPACIDKTIDIFQHGGVDSLQVLGLATSLAHAASVTFTSRDVYTNPSLASLTYHLYWLLHGNNGKSDLSREQQMAHLVTKYTADLPFPASKRIPRCDGDHVVVLTGSTGRLGSYLLGNLITDINVTKVYCLDRGNSEIRQRQAFADRGLQLDLGKVTFLKVSLGKKDFGLPAETYVDLQSNADIFIHNAWAVDFNMALESYEQTHIAGVRHIIDFCASTKYASHIVFVSSIASVGNWDDVSEHARHPVPEIWMEDHSLPFHQGYAESKHVASCILALAAEKTSTTTSIVRVGQLAGAEEGMGIWSKQEWLPTLIASSRAIGKLPYTLANADTVDWVPVDTAARIIVDFTNTALKSSQALNVFHLVNPEVTTWSELAPVVRQFYTTAGVSLDPVEYSEWLTLLKSLPKTPAQVAAVPALKLLELYERMESDAGSLPTLLTEKSADASTTLGCLRAIDADLIIRCLKQWRF